LQTAEKHIRRGNRRDQSDGLEEKTVLLAQGLHIQIPIVYNYPWILNHETREIHERKSRKVANATIGHEERLESRRTAKDVKKGSFVSIGTLSG
jgi:hypothetical protein